MRFIFNLLSRLTAGDDYSLGFDDKGRPNTIDTFLSQGKLPPLSPHPADQELTREYVKKLREMDSES